MHCCALVGCTLHVMSLPSLPRVSQPLPASCSMILTDAMALLYRSHYAFSEAHRLRNTAGKSPPRPWGWLQPCCAPLPCPCVESLASLGAGCNCWGATALLASTALFAPACQLCRHCRACAQLLELLPAGARSPAAGEDTTVLFGFMSTLLNLLELIPPPTHFAVVFDARGKTFRCWRVFGCGWWWRRQEQWVVSASD